MLLLLSPAKKQDFIETYPQLDATKPAASKQTAELVTELKTLKKSQIAKLMGVSDKIAELNFERFKRFDPKKYNRTNAKQAVFAFRGDAYRALDVDSLKPAAIKFLQEHLILLSGLYGYLKPLDLIQAYRLEMKTPLKNPQGKDLYTFWGDKIAKALDKTVELQSNKTIINLASSEYFKAVGPHLTSKVINIQFKEKKGTALKVIGIHAKRARGLMTRYAAEHKIQNPKKLQAFDTEGYKFNEKLSDEGTWLFVRES